MRSKRSRRYYQRPPSILGRIGWSVGSAVVGLFLICCAASWVALHLSALVTRRPNGVGAGEVPLMVLGWPFGQSWPTGAELPASPGVLQGTAAAVLVTTVALVVAATPLVFRGGRRLRSWLLGHDRDPEAAKWAGLWDVRRLLVRAGEHLDRLRLGRGPGGRLLAVEELHSVFVLGPSGSRKTTGLCIPALLEWPGCAVVTSVKGDLMEATRQRRGKVGQVWVFNPAAVPGVPSHGWSPLDACRSWQATREMATWLVAAAAGNKRYGTDDHAEFWNIHGAKLLGPILWAAAKEGRTMGQVVQWLDVLLVKPEDEDQDAQAEIRRILRDHGEREALRALEAAIEGKSRAPAELSGTISSTQKLMDVFSDPAVAEACSRSDIDVEALLDGPNTLYLFAPLQEQDRLRPIFEALVMMVVREGMKRAAMTGRPLDPKLLLLLDEAGNVAPIGPLAQIASTGAGQGIQLMTAWHDMAQLKHRYGDQAPTVVNNHRAKVLLSGVADLDTLGYMSTLVGESAHVEDSMTLGEQGSSTTTRTAYRRLAPLAALRRIEPGKGVLIYGHLPPVRLTLRYWRRDRTLKALAAGSTPVSPLAAAAAAVSGWAERWTSPKPKPWPGLDGATQIPELAPETATKAEAAAELDIPWPAPTKPATSTTATVDLEEERRRRRKGA